MLPACIELLFRKEARVDVSYDMGPHIIQYGHDTGFAL